MRSKKLLWLGWTFVMALVIGTVAYSVLAGRERPSLEWEPSYEAALAKAKAEHKPVMVDFYADWCGPCRELEMTTYRDPRIQKLAERFVCVKVNTDLRRDLSGRFHIDALPTIGFLKPDGTPTQSGTGYVEPDTLAPIMEAESKNAER